MKCFVTLLALCMAFGLVACGGASDEEAAQLRAAESQALEAERELEEVRQERAREEREVAQRAKREAQAKKIRRERRAVQRATQEEKVATEESATSEPPDVVGLPLPAARKALKGAGYKAAPENTDTTFGIVVEDNYTVCTQDPPRGEIVVVLAQKYGC